MPQHKPVKALQKGMALLDHLAANPQGCELAELADVLSCSVPAAFHLVQTMVTADYVRREEKPVRYFLGRTVLRLAQGVREDAFQQSVRAVMEGAYKALPGASIYFCVYQAGHVQVQRQLSQDSGSVIKDRLHHMLPPYTSVGSLVHLAFWSDEERQQYINTYPFETFGSALWGDYATFLKALRQAHKQRVAFLPCRDKAHIRAGVPLYNDDIFVASLTIQWNQRDAKIVKKKKDVLIKTIAQITAQHGVS